RKHAEIVQAQGKWVLKDCGSANGTYLNGVRVERDHPLRGGDRIRLGDTELVFETSEHNTDRFLAVAETPANTTIAIPIHDIDTLRTDTGDLTKLATLNALARELLEDRPKSSFIGRSSRSSRARAVGVA